MALFEVGACLFRAQSGKLGGFTKYWVSLGETHECLERLAATVAGNIRFPKKTVKC